VLYNKIVIFTKKKTLVDNRANKQIPDQFLAVLRIRITLMWIRILLFTLGPYPAFHFDADPDPVPTFQSDADSEPNPINQFDPDTYPDPTSHFFSDLDPPVLQYDPPRIPTFYFDAYPDPAFHFDADPDPAFHFDADPDPVSQNDVSGSTTLVPRVSTHQN
jgi:hypothetical protein